MRTRRAVLGLCHTRWFVRNVFGHGRWQARSRETSPGMVGGRVLRRSLPLTFPKTLTNQAGQRAYTEGGVNRKGPSSIGLPSPIESSRWLWSLGPVGGTTWS